MPKSPVAPPVRRVAGQRRRGTRENAGMHVSAKADYGMRALLELAAAYADSPTRLVKGEAIAKAQDIPLKFLEGILRQLRQSGIVASQRGAEGGYRLDRDPKDVSIADVVRALDGPLAADPGPAPRGPGLHRARPSTCARCGSRSAPPCGTCSSTSASPTSRPAACRPGHRPARRARSLAAPLTLRRGL